MNICAQKEYERVDKELGVIYREITNKIDPQQKVILVQSQRKWILFRDYYAKVYSSLFKGGSMEPLAVMSCKSQTTIARIAELKRLYEEISN